MRGTWILCGFTASAYVWLDHVEKQKEKNKKKNQKFIV